VVIYAYLSAKYHDAGISHKAEWTFWYQQQHESAHYPRIPERVNGFPGFTIVFAHRPNLFAMATVRESGIEST
jgi:hypothetical protein